MISRCSAESPARHFRSIALLSFFSNAVAGLSDRSSIAAAASSSNSSSGRRLSANETNDEPKHPHVVARIQHLHCKPIAVRDSSDQHLVWCRLHFGLVTLVTSDYRWVHASAPKARASGLCPGGCIVLGD